MNNPPEHEAAKHLGFFLRASVERTGGSWSDDLDHRVQHIINLIVEAAVEQARNERKGFARHGPGRAP